MKDPYFYDDCPVLRNLLNIRDEAELDKAEAELSRARMMLLYNDGFSDLIQAGISHSVLRCCSTNLRIISSPEI